MLLKELLRLSTYASIVLSPLYVVRWSYGPLPTTLLEHLIFLTLLLWVARRINKKDFSRPRSRIDFLIIVLLASCLISLKITPDLPGGLGVFKAYFVEPILFYYVLIDLLKNKIIKRKELVWTVLAASVALSLLGILQVCTETLSFASHETAARRAHAVFNSGNALALFIGPALSLPLSWQLTHKYKRDKIIRTFIFLTIALAIWLTKSDGGLLGACALITFYLAGKLLSIKTMHRLLLAAAVTYLFGHLFLFANLSYFTPSVDNPWQRTAGTGTVRFCLWEGTVNLIKEHPLTGAGLSGFKELYSRQYFTCDAEPLEYPHNLILNFWSELGLIGIIGFLGLIIFTFVTSFRYANKSNWAILGGLLYWLVHGLVDVPYFKNDLSLLFWVFMALAWSVQTRKESTLPFSQR